MNRSILLVLMVVLAGCAQTGPVDRAEDDTGQPEVAVARVQPPGPEAELLYHLMLAELAGSRGDLARAAEEYALAVPRSEDPAVAERATQVALYADRPELAIQGAERWLELAPDAGDAHRTLGLLQLRQGRLDQATEHFLAAVPAGAAEREQALARLGTLLSQESDGDAAFRVMTRVAEAFPDLGAAQYALAQVALGTDRAERAVAALDRALELDPQWRPAQLLRVEALLAADRPEAALDSLRGLLQAAPEDYELRLQYARTLVDVSRTDEALEQFGRLMEQRPEDARVLYAAALLALESGRLDRAERWFRQLLDLGERENAAHYYLGRVAERKGSFGEAVDLYSRAGGSYREEAQLRIPIALADSGSLAKARNRLRDLREANPGIAARAYAVEGEVLRSAGRLEESIELYGEGLSAYPENEDLLYGRSLAYVEADRIAEAEQDLRAILAQEPDNAAALNALGYTLADRTERYEEAESLIRRAYELRPDDPAVVDSMGWVAYRQGRLDEALDYLRRAYDLSRDTEIAAHLGEVLWQSGRREEARAVWSEALQRDPDHPVLNETIERLSD